VLLDEVFESDPKIQQQFNSLTNMSQYHPSIIVDSLLKWRRSQLAEITQMMTPKDSKKMNKEEHNLIEERIRLAVEYIFARALIPILDSLTFHKATLGTALCEDIEDIAFSFFKAPRKSEEDVEDDSVLGNRKKIPTLYAKVVGILSETRFKSIYPRFLKATTDTPARSKKAIFVIFGVRYVRFLIESHEGIELSSAFLSSLMKLFKAAQPIEVKQAISELIVRLLRLAICSISPNCDYTNWYNMLQEIYTSHSFHPKKGKYNKETVALIPMVTSILCSLRKADFLEHYREWLTRLYSALKEYKTRTVALENILFVVEAFYLKIGNELQSATNVLLEEVGSIVLTYCTSKRPMNEKGDMLDIFVDILHAMAQLSLSYTVEDVILKLLAFTNTPAANTPESISSATTPSLTGGSFLPFAPFSSAPNPYAFACEKVIIAVRAIVQLRHGETSSNEKTSKRLFSMPAKDLLTIVYNHLVQATQAPPVPIITTSTSLGSTKEAASSKESSSKDPSKESKDATKDAFPKESSKESSKDPSKDSTKDSAKDSNKDVSKETLKDSIKDVTSKDKHAGRYEKADKSDKAEKPKESPTLSRYSKDVPHTTPITTTAVPNATIPIPTSPAPFTIPPFYNVLSSRETQLSALNGYWDNVTVIWAQILLHLDSVLGHLLYSTSYKTLYDMIRPERDIIAIQLLQLLLQSIPTVVPKIPILKLVSILAKYIIHLDKGIEEMSTGALTRLMIWRPEFRPLIISGLADFATTLSHNRPDLVFTLLFKLGQLFKQWLEIIKPPFELPRGSHIPPSTAAELDNFPTTKIEGIALIFLCSPKSKIRLLALEILKSVRSVETLLRKSSATMPTSSSTTSTSIMSNMMYGSGSGSGANTPTTSVASTASTATSIASTIVGGNSGPRRGSISSTNASSAASNPLRVSTSSMGGGGPLTTLSQFSSFDVTLAPIRIMDIIDEAGPDIIRTLQSDSRYFSSQTVPVAVKTIERLAARDTREDQWLWSSVLGELLRHFSLLQPEPALLAAYLIQSRMREVKPDDKETPPEQEEMLYWWRNYITLECVVLVPHFLHTLPSIFNLVGSTPITHNNAHHASTGPITSSHNPSTSSAPSATLSRELSGSSSTGFGGSGGGGGGGGGAGLSGTGGGSSGNLRSSDQHGSSAPPMLPKDVFAMVLPYLRSNNDMLRESSVMALQRTNFASAEVLAECLRSFEKEFQGDHSDKKRRQKRNRLRLEVTSIYASIVESIHQTALCRNPSLRRHIVLFVTELHQHLKSNRNMFDMLQLRYQYCVIVSRLTEELHAGTQASRDFQQSKEEIALRKNAFNLLSAWCSADIFQDEGTKKHLNSLLSPIKDGEKRKAYVNALREHIMVLQFSALTAMSSCLLGPHFEAILPGDAFFDFVDGFLRHPLDKVRLLARFMLESFLSGNISQAHVLHMTLNKSYHVDTEIANQYFLCLVTLFPEDIIFACTEVVLLHLIVYMIGNSDFHVRRAARELLLMLKSLTNSDEQWLTTVPFVVDSSLPENYERAQLDLSVRLADFHPEAAPEMITEMVVRLDTVAPNSKRQMLRSIVPWIEKLEFHIVSRQVLDSLMENLLFVTMRYKQDFPREVEQLWTTVARTNRNLQVVIRELIAIGMIRQNTEIIPLAKFVCIYLARTASKVVIDTLVSELSAGELPISGGSRRNTLTFSDRNAALKKAGFGGGNQQQRNGVSSLGGSQSNSQASMPSYAAEGDVDESGGSSNDQHLSRARAKSDASSAERDEMERPRSSTTGERLVTPLGVSTTREERRLSIGSNSQVGLGTTTTTTTTTTTNPTVLLSTRSGVGSAAGGIASMTTDSAVVEARSTSEPHIPPLNYNKPAKEIEAKLGPSENPAFDPVEIPTSSSKMRRTGRRREHRKHRRREQRDAQIQFPSFSNIGSSDDEDSSGTSTTSTFGVHPFQKLIPILTAPWGLTRAHYILTILAQLTYETSEQFRDHLPIIFQLAFLGIDFPNPLVYEHCRIILLNLIHSLIVLPLEQIDSKTWALQEKYSEALHLVEYLRANQGEPLWAHEDVTMKKPEIRSASQLTSLVQAIIKAFSPANRPPLSGSSAGSDLAETWAAQALTWAVHGQSWHITGRSFQIYRALRPAITRDAQNDLLECLLRSMSTSKSKRKSSNASKSGQTQSRENLALTIEVLITLQTLVRAQSAQKLILFPQMFWTSVALLQTDYEPHYLASLKLLSDLLDRLDFSDPYVQNIFSASIPKEWNPPFRGIQHLVVRGLYSPMTESKAIDVLSKLVLIPFDQVLHPEPGRLFHTITCLLPFVCSNVRNPSFKRQSSDIAAHLSQACAQQRLSELSRIFAKLSRFEYESMEDFIWDFKRPFGNALVQLQQSILGNSTTSNATSNAANASVVASSSSNSTATPSKRSTITTGTNTKTVTTSSSSGVVVPATISITSGGGGGTTSSSSTTSTTNATTTGNAPTTNTNGQQQSADDESSLSDSPDQKQFFRLESALAILFNILEHSSTSWRRSTLLIILALLQHRYPPPQSSFQSPQGTHSARLHVPSRESTDRGSSATVAATAADPSSSSSNLKAPPSTLSMTSDGPRLSVGSIGESLERVMQPSWLVTLLKQMSSSSWQQALLILDLALQHSAITVSELDPFVLKASKSIPSGNVSPPNTSPGGHLTSSMSSPGPKRKSDGTEIFCNRSSIGVASASLALDKILSTEHRKRNLTLDSSLLSMFDGWYTKETEVIPPKNLRKKLSSVAELDSDIDESISTEDQISYLLQTEHKGSGTKTDPYDPINTPVPASTLGRFPTFRGFDELLSKLESMPSTPMTTLDSKPTGLFSDSISNMLDSSSGKVDTSTVVIRKSSSKKIKSPSKQSILLQADIGSSETTETTNSMEEHHHNKPKSPRRGAVRSSLSSSTSSSSSYVGASDDERASEIRRSNSYKFRMSLDPRNNSTNAGRSGVGNESHTESQAESSANESDAGIKSYHRTPVKSSTVGRTKKPSGSPSSPPSFSKLALSGSPNNSSAPLSDPVLTKLSHSPTAKVHAATFRPISKHHQASPSSSSRSGTSSSVKRSKTSTPTSSAASKYPSGASDDPATTSPVGSGRLKKLEFSFSSELLLRTKRWRAALQREPSSEPSSDDLPALFKTFSSATKLLTSIRADFRSCLTFYCRLVVPTHRPWLASEKSTHDPSAPHRALSELLGRMTPELDHVVPKIPDLMLEMMPLKYKRIVKRDLAFASGFRDQRTKFIDDVKQCHLAYTEQRVAAENIKSKLQEIEHEVFEDDNMTDKDELCLTSDKLAMEFAISVLQLHMIALNTLLVQASVGSIVCPLLESYSPENVETAKEHIIAELGKSRNLILGLQNNLLTLN
jgi:hypothetical protein